jgi:hypothetical protein
VTLKNDRNNAASQTDNNILIFTTGFAGDTGSLILETGNASAGDSGDVSIQTGTASGTRGEIKLKNGSEGTIGHIWTSTGTAGEGGWAAASGGGGDAWSDLVDSNIIPDGNGTREIGNGANGFKKLYMATTTTANNYMEFDFGTNRVGNITYGDVSGHGVNYDLGFYTNDVNAPLFVGTTERGSAVIIETGTSSTSGQTGDISLTTGDNSSTGNSGDINITTGTISTGTRGKIAMDAEYVVFPLASSDPSGGEAGAVYFNTSSNVLRFHNGTSWGNV